ncbi:MAG: hypothetical protein ACOC31_03155 [Bacteroidota bacterium]
MKQTGRYKFLMVFVFLGAFLFATSCSPTRNSNRRVYKQVCLDYFNYKTYSKYKEIEKEKRENQLKKAQKERQRRRK